MSPALYRKVKRILKCNFREESVGSAVVEAVKYRLDSESARLLGRSISGDRSAFFAGAGASVESGLPNFKDFSEHILSSTLPRHKDITKDDVAMFASELRPEMLLQTLHEFYGDEILDFYEWFEGAKPSTSHYALAKALRQGSLVLTTNIDTLIEDAYEDLYGEKDFNLLVTSQDFKEFPRQRLFCEEGVLIKLHGTIDSSKSGRSRYDTIRFLLVHVGEGGSTSMRSLLTYICREFDMIYLGYSGCDCNSVLPVLCDVATNHTTLWLWNEWTRKDAILDNSGSGIYEKELSRVGELLVLEGKSFAEIPRGMETLLVCDILSSRRSAFRCRCDIGWIMHTAVPDNRVIRHNRKEAPTTTWLQYIPNVTGIRCAARLYSILGRLDMSIALLIEANNLSSTPSRQKALILKELGNQYVNVHLSSSYENGLKCLEESRTIFNDLGDHENLLDTQLDIADTLRRMMHLDEANELLLMLKEIFAMCEHEAFIQKAMIRHGLIQGLILGIGRADIYSKNNAIIILDETADTAAEKGFVSLHAAILNASCLIKYQISGQSVERLESVAIDLDTAVHLNLIIGDYRSSFRQLRVLGIVKMDLMRLTREEELVNEGIKSFRHAEKILFRLSQSQVLGELLEIRFLLGEALVKAKHLEEAEQILLDVQKHRIRLRDWYNEALTLELLVKTAKNSNDLIERCMKIKAIYEDAKTNQKTKKRFKIEPHILNRGRYILRTAANLVRAENEELAIELQKLMVDAFVD